jgi:hypothetical protein
MAYVKPRSEIVEHYNNCKAAIEASCEGFDNGQLWEAQRLASSVYSMVHDGGKNSQSILTQLGLRASTNFTSYVPQLDKENLIPSNPLVLYRITIGVGAEVRPMLDNGPRRSTTVQFPTWWEKEFVFYHDGSGLSRRGLVFSLRNQDGGAHVDAKLTDEEYIAMKLTASRWSYVSNGQPPEKIIGEELATMRHVAYEMLSTLDLLGEVS